MRIVITEKQFKKIVLKSIGNQELSEEGEEGGAPESGASSDGEKKTGATKWESGVTRGPGNQIGNTKWSDIVGSQLKRGKANPLNEQQVRNATIGPARGYEGDPNYVPFQDGPNTKDPYRRTKTDPIILKYPNFFKGPMSPDFSFGQDKNRATKTIGDKPPFYVYSKARNSWDLVNDPNVPNAIDGYRTVNIGPFMGQILKDFVKFNSYRDRDGGLKKTLTNAEIMVLISLLIPNPIADIFSPENIQKTDMQRYFDRISKSGRDVPKGYDPDLYDEYIAKKEEILNQIKKVLFASPYKAEMVVEKAKVLNKQLVDLEKQYYNKYFSYGLTPEEYDLYNARMDALQKEYTPKLMALQFERERMPKVDKTYVAKTGMPNKPTDAYTTLLDEYRTEVKRVVDMFGYDYVEPNVGWFGEKFDAWWDEYGTAVQIVGNILIVAAATIATAPAGGSGGPAAATFLGVSTSFLRAAAPYIADAAFNGFIGAYELSRGQDEQALLSFVCALLPFYSYTGNLGKVSMKEATILAEKIAKADLASAAKIQRFVRTLTPKERYIFRNVGSMPKEAIKRDMDLAVKNLQKRIKTIQKGTGSLPKNVAGRIIRQTTVPKVGMKIWAPPVLKQIGVEGGTPLAVGIANRFLEIVKNRTGKQFTPEEIKSIKDALKRLSDEEKLYFWSEYVADENKPLDEKTTQSAPGIVKNIEQSMFKNQSPKKKEEADKRMDEYFKDLEVQKKLKQDATTNDPY